MTISRSKLLRLAYEARDEVIPDRDAEDGDCQPVAETLIKLLREQGFRAGPVFGHFQGHAHEWMHVGSLYCDPTRDQFRHFVDDDKVLDQPVAIWRAKGRR